MPLDLEIIIAKMLEKDPDRRYPNVDTILVDLQRATAKLHLVYSQEVFRDWMEEHEYESVSQMCGAVRHSAIADPSAYERANYIGNLVRYTSAFLGT